MRLPPIAASLLLLLATASSAQTELFAIDGESDNELFASHIANVGDLDGDGHDDLAVSATSRNIESGPNQGNRGVIELRSGSSGALIRTLENSQPISAGFFALDLARTEDADLDGLDDLMVGTFHPVDGSARVLRISTATGAVLDEVVAPAGGLIRAVAQQVHDVDGDGRRDLLVLFDRPGTGSTMTPGLLAVSGLDLSILAQITPAQVEPGYGTVIEPLGDIDGDGVPDVAVGSSLNSQAAQFAGKVFLHSGADWSIIDTIPGRIPEQRFGRGIAALPDVDGDGVADLAVSSPFFFAPATRAFVTVFSGSTRAPLLNLTSVDLDDAFGFAVEAVGDVDGNGTPDLAVGAPSLLSASTSAGRVDFYSLDDGELLGSASGTEDGQLFGRRLETLSDSNANGFMELAAAGNGNGTSVNTAGRVAVLEGPVSPPCGPAIPFCGQTAPNSVGGLAQLELLSGGHIAGIDTRLLGSEMPPGAASLLLTSLETGFASMPGGRQGNLCLGGSIGRFTSSVGQVGPQGRIVFAVDLEELPTPLGTVAANPDQQWHFQAWYRDANPSPTSNFTSAVTVDICP